MTTISATPRIEDDGSAILVFHADIHPMKAEAYSRTDGHVTVTRDYIQRKTTPVKGPDDEAQAERLIEHYRALLTRDNMTLHITSRIKWMA